ncbi:uncharacterized protein [Palaemon carinicauda]|uniref:uncharacterized protein n=1 Tax=Palaemon carinicauda TaxID=392227 RepID=UPI0035B69EE8
MSHGIIEDLDTDESMTSGLVGETNQAVGGASQLGGGVVGGNRLHKQCYRYRSEWNCVVGNSGVVSGAGYDLSTGVVGAAGVASGSSHTVTTGIAEATGFVSETNQAVGGGSQLEGVAVGETGYSGSASTVGGTGHSGTVNVGGTPVAGTSHVGGTDTVVGTGVGGGSQLHSVSGGAIGASGVLENVDDVLSVGGAVSIGVTNVESNWCKQYHLQPRSLPRHGSRIPLPDFLSWKRIRRMCQLVS